MILDPNKPSASLEETLRKVLHDMETTQGLWATDNLHAYSDAMSEGADSNGAWDAFVEGVFQISFPSLTELRQVITGLEADHA